MGRLLAMVGMSALLAGCGPYVEVVQMDERAVERARAEVPAYQAEQLQPFEYRLLEPISATSCRNLPWERPIGREDAIGQLRAKARRLGGNAILNPVCKAVETASLATGCWQALTCSATAIAVGASASRQLPSSATPARGSGTGFVVDPDGLVLTAFHVVQDATAISVTCPGRPALPAEPRALTRNNDLALLRVPASGLPYLSIGKSGALRLGDPVFTIGYPATDILGPEPKFTDGAVSALAGLLSEASLLQMTVPVQPGNSGGPVVNTEGYAVGVVTSSAAVRPFLKATGALPQNINWAVKADYAAPLFDAPPLLPPAGNRTEAIRRTEQATCRIEASR